MTEETRVGSTVFEAVELVFDVRTVTGKVEGIGLVGDPSSVEDVARSEFFARRVDLLRLVVDSDARRGDGVERV